MRLDVLVMKQFNISRNRAQVLIKEGDVFVDGKCIQKVSFDVNENAIITKNNVENFVSRGAFKLIKAIDFFKIDFNDKVILDMGASTGGFTEVALKYGASGYLLKGCSLEELSSAIHSVLSGGACFNPNVAGKVAQFFSQMANSNSEFSLEHEEDFDLSDTERQIIAQIGHGYSNKEIAQKLGFSEGTIRNYLSVILDKLDLRDRTQLAIWYLSRGNK